MSGRSARNYWTDAQLAQDAAYWRKRDRRAERDAWVNELVRRFVAGEPLSKADKREARRILKEREA